MDYACSGSKLDTFFADIFALPFRVVGATQYDCHLDGCTGVRCFVDATLKLK